MIHGKQFILACTIIFNLTTLSVARAMQGRTAACTVKGATQRLHGGTEYNHDNVSAQPVINSRYQAGTSRIKSTMAAQ
jgi:hypothetical protein